MKILDPACGSGSFLIGAYQFLLDWYLEQYSANPEKYLKGRSPRIRQVVPRHARAGDRPAYVLTVAERKRILLDHIFGVDIDYQAVEVTKLSLLLNVLEAGDIGIQLDYLAEQQKRAERALPDLGNNIKCGNSLIGPDFYDHHQMELDEDQRMRINVFDWEAEFPEIMRNGGFDAVIGNPPYVRIQTMQETAPETLDYYKEHYAAAAKGNYDIYVLFAERGLELLNANGLLGYILPHKFFNAKYGEPLREVITKGRHLNHVVNFTDEQVFRGASTYTCLMFLSKAPSETVDYVRVDDLEAWRNKDDGAQQEHVPAERFTPKEWNIALGPSGKLFERLQEMPTKLEDVAEVFVGTQTSADDVFVLQDCRDVEGYVIGKSKALQKEVKVEQTGVKKFLRGRDIRRYEPLVSTDRLICPYVIAKDNFRLLTLKEMKDDLPLTFAYLTENRSTLERREKGRFKNERWYAFGYPKSMTLFERNKIVVPDYNNVASFAWDTEGHFYKTAYGIILTNTELSNLYVLGLLNSRLIFQYLVHTSTSLRGGYIRFWTQYTSQLPIRTIDFDNPADKTRHDQMVELVDRMLTLHQQRANAKTNYDKTAIQRQIDATDRQIDRLVYELYELTDAEIAIVEGRQ